MAILLFGSGRESGTIRLIMYHPHDVSRRSLLAAAAGLAVTPLVLGALAGEDGEAAPEELPLIPLGRTERTLPRLGLGAAQIAHRSEEEGIAIVAHALEAGMRYFDTAPSYGEGRSEERLGRGLKAAGVPREALFINTKTLHRDGDGARRELESSLKRLQLDYVDSLQVHEIHGDWQRLFEKGSVLPALEKARDEGLVRHIGITAHRNPAHAIEACLRFDFATALVPVNPLDVQHLSFIREFLAFASEREIGVVAMKIYAGGHLVTGGRFKAAELVRYALSQENVAIVVPGCERVEHVDAALEAVRPFSPLDEDAQRELEQRVGEHHGRDSEWYKEPRQK